MTLLVRNDDDILDANLRYHLAQGVDLVIATDHASVDDSREILEDYRRQGHLVLLEETGASFYSGRWRTRMARMAAADFGADWIITPDPDEFLWPAFKTLREVFAAIPPEFSVLVTPRPEFIPTADDGGFFADRMVVRQSIASSPPKVAHRAFEDIQVSSGNHSVAIGDRPMKRAHSNLMEAPFWPIRTFHFRFRGYAEFEKNVRRRIETNFDGRDEVSLLGYGHAPPADVATAYREERLAELYRDKFVLQPAALTSGLQNGTLVVDRRFKQFFAGGPSTPGDLEKYGELRAESDPSTSAYLGWSVGEATEVQREMGIYLSQRFKRAERRRGDLERRLEAVERSRWWRIGQRLRPLWEVPLRSGGRLKALVRSFVRPTS